MNCLPRFACRAIRIGSVVFCLLGCGETKTDEDNTRKEVDPNSIQGEDLSTPDKTLAAVKAAAGDKNDAKMCRYFTPAARHDQAAFLVVYGIRMQIEAGQAVQNPKGKGDPAEKKWMEDEQKRAAAIQTLFQKHKLTSGNVSDVVIDRNASPAEQKKQWRKLAEPIKDHCQFFADFLKLMREYANSPDARMIEEDAELKNLEIKGDRAQAEFVHSRGGREQRSPIVFEKIDDQWLISEVPNLLH